MTISSATRKAGPFLGNGVTTSYPFTFKVFQASDLQLIKTTSTGVDLPLVLNSDYSISLNADQNASPGGTITYPLSGSALQTGEKLTVTGVLADLQGTHITNGGNFFANNIEDQMDYLTILVQQHSEKLGRSILGSASDQNVSLLLGTAVQRALKYIGFDANGNLIVVSALPGSNITPASLGAVLYPISAAENTAGIVPVNLVYPCGYVDRYLTNTGSNDMAPAFTAAGKVASLIGCKARWGATAPYHLNTPVNWTGIHGVVFEDESGGAASSSLFNTIFIGHNGIAFDLATSYELTFNNMVVATSVGSVPKCLFFSARNVALSGCGIHRFNNFRTPTTLTANFLWYGYGSEENIFTNCECFNSQPGSALFSHNGSNPSNFSSTFVTIATGGPQSNTVNRHLGSSYFNTGNSGSHNEVVFQLEDTADFTFRDGLWGCAHGDCYVQVIGTQASLRLAFDSIRGEPLGTQPAHGVNVTATSGTHVQWTFNNVNGDSSGFFLVFAAGASIQNLAMRATSTTSGNLLLACNMSNSVIETLVDSVVQGQAGGTVSGNVFIGGRNNITANGGTFSGNLYADNVGGGFGVDNDLFTSTSAACTGALTTSISYQIRLSPNGKQVTLNLPAIQGTTTAAASFTLAVAIPAQYRPSSNLRQLAAIVDNGGTLNQAGQVFVTASTGIVLVFKDIVGTGTWTNGATGGLASETELTWNL